MTPLVKVRVTKKLLASLPLPKRNFYMLAGQSLNDLNILRKLLQIAIRGVRDDSPSSCASTAQTLLILKLLAGRAYECHRTINSAFSSKLRSMLGEMPEDSREELDKINRYFGKKNQIQRIRSKFAFHLDGDELNGIFSSLEDDADLFDYFSIGHERDSLYYSAEMITLNAILGKDKSEWAVRLRDLVDETVRLTGHIRRFLTAYMACIAVEYFGLSEEDVASPTVIANVDAALFSDGLPFFHT